MGDLKRWFQYNHDGEPIMCLAPKRSRSVEPAVFVIRLGDAYLFRDEMFLRQYALEMCERLDLGLLTVERFSQIRSFIEDGLDELVGMKPVGAIYDDAPRVIGEGTLISSDGQKHTFEVTDRILQ